MNIWTLQKMTHGVEATMELGRRVGACLRGGDILALVGTLGAGKTHLAKGLAAGIGVNDSRSVTSPTFVIVNEYAGRERVLHIDAFRLSGAEELSNLGFEEMCQGGAIIIVEWADRVRELMPPRSLWITITVCGESQRQMAFSTIDSDIATRVSAALDRQPPAADNPAGGVR